MPVGSRYEGSTTVVVGENIEKGRRPQSETNSGQKLPEAAPPDPDEVSAEPASTGPSIEVRTVLGPTLAKLMGTKDVKALRAAALLWVANRIEDAARELEVEIQSLDDHRIEGGQERAHTLQWCHVESKSILTGPDQICPACGATIDT